MFLVFASMIEKGKTGNVAHLQKEYLEADYI
jgi:hypothetical protein